MKQTVKVLTLALVLGGLVAPEALRPLAAQHRPGGYVGIGFVAANAVGELQQTVDRGFGLELSGSAPMAADGLLRARADLGFLVYGLERLFYCDLTCRVGSELTTTNTIVYGGIGPELAFSNGPIQPYVNASAGLSYFVTSSSLDDNDGYGPYLETTNFSDAVFAWRVGGGVRMALGSHRPIFLDVGIDRHDNGIATYLTEGDIVDNPDGTVTLFPNRSDADLVTVRLGVSIGIR